MVRATILEGGIDNMVGPEIDLAMTYIKNQQPIQALKSSISLMEMHNQALPNLHYLYILGSSVYVFLKEEEQSLKSTKWETHALRGKLVGFDGHSIYNVHIEDQNKVLRIKDPRIFEDITFEAATSLPDFEKKPTFGGVQITDEQLPSDERSASNEKKNLPKSRARLKKRKKKTRPPNRKI